MGILRFVTKGIPLVLAAGLVACGGSDEPPAGGGDYKVPDRVECLGDGSNDYLGDGPFSFTMEVVNGYQFYLPDTPAGCRNPAVGFAMGTGASIGSYTAYYESYASWGLAVVADPDPQAGSGASMKEAIEALYDRHGDRLGKAGVTGHSQGGMAAVNASEHSRFEAVVGLQSGQFATRGNYSLPFLAIAAENDSFGGFTDSVTNHYPKFTGPKFYGKLVGAGHSPRGSQGDAARAASQAWFRCHLGGDTDACSLFSSATCSDLAGDWMNCQGTRLP